MNSTALLSVHDCCSVIANCTAVGAHGTRPELRRFRRCCGGIFAVFVRWWKGRMQYAPTFAQYHSFGVHNVPPFAFYRSRLPLCTGNRIGHGKNYVLCRKNYIRHNSNYIRPFFAAFKSQKHKPLQRIFSVWLLFCEPASCAILALLRYFRQLSALVRCRSRVVADCTAVGAYGIRPELRRSCRRLATLPPVLRRDFRGSCAAVWRAYAIRPRNRA